MASRFGMQIRAAAGSDVEGLAQLLRAAGRPIAEGVLAVRLAAFDADGAGTVRLAVEWGAPSGLVAVGWGRTLADDLPVARIDALVVAPDDRRRGIGRLLLKAAAQAARAAGCGTILVPVAGGDASLRAFCEANGFTGEGALYARPLRKRSDAGSHF